MIENGFDNNLRNISKHRSNLNVGNETMAIDNNEQDNKIEVLKQNRIRKQNKNNEFKDSRDVTIKKKILVT